MIIATVDDVSTKRRTPAFWAAYIVTRPLGASLGDFLSQPKDQSGLGLGTTTTSLIFLAAILALVTFLAITKIDKPALIDETD